MLPGMGLLLGFPLLIYSLTIAPSVTFIDSGELISVSRFLGIAHPTGYPLYTLLGRLFTFFGGNRPAVAMNFMSSFFSAAASLLLGVVVYRALGGSGKVPGGLRPDRTRALVAVMGGFLFAFSRTMWQVSTETEVYSLAALFTVLLLLLSWPILSIGRRAGRGKEADTLWVLPGLGYVWGLSMGNHMSAVLFFPVVVYLFYRLRVWEGRGWRGVALFIVSFLLGFSIYLYIPIRSALDPLLNWGEPHNPDAFIRHLTAWQYRIWMFSGDFEVLIDHVEGYIQLLLSQFHPVIWLFVLPGGITLYRRRRSLAIALAILFLSDLLYSMNYDIPDIAPYFIPSFAVLVITVAAGVYQVGELTVSRAPSLSLPLALAAFVLPASAIRANYPICDRSGDFMANELATNLLETVSERAVVLTGTWDLYSPTLYLQLVEEKRGDVVMIDYELMRRSWYVRQLMERHPDLFGRARDEADHFLELVAAFEGGRPFDSRRLESAFNAMLTAVLLADYPERPAYIDFEDKPFIAPALKRDPEGLIFQLREGYDGTSTDVSRYRLRSTLDPAVYRDERALWIRSLYPRYALKEGIILQGLGKDGEAVRSFETALFFSPNHVTVLKLLGEAYLRAEQLSRAIGCYRRILLVDPGNQPARERLGEIERSIRGEP